MESCISKKVLARPQIIYFHFTTPLKRKQHLYSNLVSVPPLTKPFTVTISNCTSSVIYIVTVLNVSQIRVSIFHFNG